MMNPITVGVLHGFVQNEGDAYALTLNSLSRFFEWTQLSTRDEAALVKRTRHPLELAYQDAPESLFSADR